MIGYSDSDFAKCVGTKKSTSRFIFLLVGGVISWSNYKQTIVVTSTIDAKFIACYEAAIQALGLRNFLSNLKTVNLVERPLKIFNYNSIAIFLFENNKRSIRSKHIDITFLGARENIKRNEVFIEHISIELTIVDPMTKSLRIL